jgi:hypothetical protein
MLKFLSPSDPSRCGGIVVPLLLEQELRIFMEVHMSIEQKVLKVLIENGSLDDEDQKVRGIAQLAVDKGYDHLTGPQQSVVQPFLSRTCDGVEDPGGHDNNCQVTLEGSALVEALSNESYYGGVLCESCVNESEQYSNEWERIQAE